MGKTLLYGIVMAIPAVVIAGPFLGRRMQVINPPMLDCRLNTGHKELPGAWARS